MGPVAHLYVHVPFCAHRCGYCDFVTVTGNEDRHAAYIDALLAEFDSERRLLATPLTTIFIGGGTPTLLGPALLDRLLGSLPTASEITVEANPETVDDALAEVLVRHGARVSLGAQSFGARELAVLERRATRRSRSSPTISPATSSRPSRARASPTRTGRSSRGRRSCSRITTST
jgi:oxygen-independent coproporphyrinogen-3 oxidase